MLIAATLLTVLLALPSSAFASPVRKWNSKKSYYDYFDLQGHRGTRGAVVERCVFHLLPSLRKRQRERAELRRAHVCQPGYADVIADMQHPSGLCRSPQGRRRIARNGRCVF